jgi:hypothetical protein
MKSMPILQRAVNRAAAKAGTPPPLPSSPASAYIALSVFPDLHFMGIAQDCGLVLGNSSLSSAAVLSVIRAREAAQAKLTEASDLAAAKEAARVADASQKPAEGEFTSVGTRPPIQAVKEDQVEETGDPEFITVVSLSKKRKQKKSVPKLPTRTNLRSTPTRQARALLNEAQ